MYRYGITNKSGECQVVSSDLDIENFIKHLHSAEWVCLNFCVPCRWITPGMKDIAFNNIMVSIKNIESICLIESEE